MIHIYTEFISGDVFCSAILWTCLIHTKSMLVIIPYFMDMFSVLSTEANMENLLVYFLLTPLIHPTNPHKQHMTTPSSFGYLVSILHWNDKWQIPHNHKHQRIHQRYKMHFTIAISLCSDTVHCSRLVESGWYETWMVEEWVWGLICTLCRFSNCFYANSGWKIMLSIIIIV